MSSIKSVQISFESKFEQVSKAGEALREICSEFSLSKKELYQLELGLIEALNNVIMHSYLNKPGNPIDVHISLDASVITFLVYDSGLPKKDFLNKSYWDFDPYSSAALPDSGMGLHIIHQIMDDVSYESKNGMNVICMRKKLNLL